MPIARDFPSKIGAPGSMNAYTLDGGFTPDAMTPKPLPILYANDLEAMQAKVEAAGGAITHAIFAFPGGRRFHFRDPSGNELAVWSEK